jgi:hypothetical protein
VEDPFSFYRNSVGVSVRVTVVVVVVYLDRRAATVGHFTIDTFELNGGVVNAESFPQDRVDLLQNEPAF